MTASLLSPGYVHGVYIPSALLVFGTYIVKSDWVPYAIGIALLLGGWKIYNNGPSHPSLSIQSNPPSSSTQSPPSQGIPRIPSQRKDHPLPQHRHVPSPSLIDFHTNPRSYRFSLPRPTDILGLPIGQHITLAAVLDPTIKPGKSNPDLVLRSYTPVSSDTTPGHFDLLIKSYPTGNISKHVASLRIGDTLKVKGPKGAMVYEPNMVRRIGMIAGGTGITPMLQMIRAIVRGRASGDKTEVDLIFANVNREDILLKEDLDALAKEDPLFRIYYVLNNPPEGWTGGIGFVTAEMIKERLPAPAEDIKILVCGPPPMVNAMKKACEVLGYRPTSKPVSKLQDQLFCF
jgi:cytochrome-b5 reductase